MNDEERERTRQARHAPTPRVPHRENLDAWKAELLLAGTMSGFSDKIMNALLHSIEHAYTPDERLSVQWNVPTFHRSSPESPHSRPFVVATQMQMASFDTLESTEENPARVLEIGAGGGRSTCMISELLSSTVKLISMEPIIAAAREAQSKVRSYPYAKTRHIRIIGEAFSPDTQRIHRPFDRIQVEAAMNQDEFESAVIPWGKPGAILTVPILCPATCKEGCAQRLWKFVLDAEKKITEVVRGPETHFVLLHFGTPAYATR